MPLWMVLTKWPAPSGPISAAQGSPSNLAETSSRIFSTRFHACVVPPAMIEGPWRAPTSPPETPMPRNSKPWAPSSFTRRWVSRKLALPASISRSPWTISRPILSASSSTGGPAITMRTIGRGGADGGGQLPDRLARHQPLGERAGIGHEAVDLRRRAVVNGDRVALLGHVEGEVGAHHSETDETDIRHGAILLLS